MAPGGETDLVCGTGTGGAACRGCPATQHCATGTCGCTAPTALNCGGVCQGPTTANSCGAACGVPCPGPTSGTGTTTCNGTTCAIMCTGGLSLCNGACIDESNNATPNAANCGGCGATFTCTGGKTCQSGACACPAGQHLCASTGTCASDTDPNNCGASCTLCTAPGGGTVSCVAGVCTAGCTAPQIVCNNTCVDPTTSNANCGGCGNVCGAGTSCAAPGVCACSTTTGCTGCCSSPTGAAACVTAETDTVCGTGTGGAACRACTGGQHCSGGTCACTPPTALNCGGTCEGPTTANSCGATCGVPCPGPTSGTGTTTCNGTTCAIMCTAGLSLCNGACIDESNNATPNAPNCGGCGPTFTCAGGKTCQGGVCACPAGQHLCASTGTCASDTDANNCGPSCTLCTAPGGGTVSCVAGVCTAGCTAPQIVCNNACVNPNTSNANCGGCGNVCGAGTTCAAGACACNTTTGCTGCCSSPTGATACVTAETDTVCGTGTGGAACRACTGGQHCSGGTCGCTAPTALNCGGTCEGPTTANSCGAMCNMACPGPTSGTGTTMCNGTTCAITCTGGLSLCNGACIDESNNATPNAPNCGGCGPAFTCTGGTTCQNGACACPSGQALCNGTCITTSQCVPGTPGNACDIGCNMGATCGDTGLPVPSGTVLTGSSCIPSTPGLCTVFNFSCTAGVANCNVNTGAQAAAGTRCGPGTDVCDATGICTCPNQACGSCSDNSQCFANRGPGLPQVLCCGGNCNDVQQPCNPPATATDPLGQCHVGAPTKCVAGSTTCAATGQLQPDGTACGQSNEKACINGNCLSIMYGTCTVDADCVPGGCLNGICLGTVSSPGVVSCQDPVLNCTNGCSAGGPTAPAPTVCGNAGTATFINCDAPDDCAAGQDCCFITTPAVSISSTCMPQKTAGVKGSGCPIGSLFNMLNVSQVCDPRDPTAAACPAGSTCAGSGPFVCACPGGGIPTHYCFDMDGDGDGDPNNQVVTCGTPPPGFITSCTDCCDSDPSQFFGSTKCDSVASLPASPLLAPGPNLCGTFNYNCQNNPNPNGDPVLCDLTTHTVPNQFFPQNCQQTAATVCTANTTTGSCDPTCTGMGTGPLPDSNCTSACQWLKTDVCGGTQVIVNTICNPACDGTSVVTSSPGSQGCQ